MILNTQGQARVRLPRWFEALNGDLRYQLTPIGSPAPELHVSQEVREGVFVIAGGSPRQKVCWQITGVRRDAWAKANPLAVEQSKRKARPRVAAPKAADLERQSSMLREQGALLKKTGAERERRIKSRRVPAPSPVSPPTQPPAADTQASEMAKKLLEALEQLEGRQSSPGSSVSPR